MLTTIFLISSKMPHHLELQAWFVEPVQWRIQDFPEGGAWTLQGGREHAKFSRKLHEIERIWTPRGGRASLTPPPRSANAVLLYTDLPVPLLDSCPAWPWLYTSFHSRSMRISSHTLSSALSLLSPLTYNVLVWNWLVFLKVLEKGKG